MLPPVVFRVTGGSGLKGSGLKGSGFRGFRGCRVYKICA